MAAQSAAKNDGDTSPLEPVMMSQFMRIVAWGVTCTTLAFLINNILTFWFGFPGFYETVTGLSSGHMALASIQGALYVLAILLPVAYVMRYRDVPLRAESLKLYAITAYIIRAAYWAVLLIGVADMVVSMLRVENLLPMIVGDHLTSELGRSQFRGMYLHVPLILLSLVIAAFTRTLGFIWLTLLVVGAEFQIVVARFVFSYEQAYMGDLVRFWYGALFLFASAYTLIEEGHVRVDVLFAGFSDRTKGYVNVIGSVTLGMALCWVILIMGMWGKSTLINSPILSFEVSQSGFGMYIKYLMSGFLAIFAVSMLVQFSGYMLEGAADIRGEPNKRKLATALSH